MSTYRLHEFADDDGLDRRRLVEAFNDAAKGLSEIDQHEFARRTIDRDDLEIDAILEMGNSFPSAIDHTHGVRQKIGGTKIEVDAYTEGMYKLAWSIAYEPANIPLAGVSATLGVRAWPVINGRNLWGLRDQIFAGYPFDKDGALLSVALGELTSLSGWGVAILDRGVFDGYVQVEAIVSNNSNEPPFTITKAMLNWTRIVR